MSQKLHNGHTIPQIQLGLYMMSGREVLASVPWALAAGYRGFDSAQMYHNEAEAGQAIRKWLESSENTSGPNLTREDIWYTSKLASSRYVCSDSLLLDWRLTNDLVHHTMLSARASRVV